MPAATYNIQLEQGADWSRDLVLTTSTAGSMNLSDRTFVSQIRQFPSGAVATSISCTVVSAAAGLVRLSVTSAGTLLVPTAGAQYDLFMVTNTGTSTRLLAGSVSVAQRITVA